MSIKYDITSEIDTQIDAITIVGGYNSDYDNVNEHRPANKTFPNALSTYLDEEFLDPDEQVVNSYSGFLTARFKIAVDDTISPPRLALSNVLEDFERLFEAMHADLQGKGQIVSELMEDTESFTNKRQRPGMIDLEFRIFYRVKRSDPSSTI